MAMTTLPVTNPLDAHPAEAHTSASAEDQATIQRLLSLRLQELVASAHTPLRAVRDQVGHQTDAQGLTPEMTVSAHPEVSHPPTAEEPNRDRLALLRRGRGLWRDRD